LFFEWINNEPEFCYTIQRINNELDGGEVIHQEFVDVTSARTFREARRLVREVRYKLYLKAFENIQKQNNFPIPKDSKLSKMEDADKFLNVMRFI